MVQFVVGIIVSSALIIACAGQTTTKAKRSNSPILTDVPAIGILSLPAKEAGLEAYGVSFIEEQYVTWLEAAGAQVIPIDINANISELTGLMYSVNGLVFTPGVDIPFFITEAPTNYTSVGCYLYQLALQINDEAAYFPVWASQIGTELLNVCNSLDLSIMTELDGQTSYASKLEFTSDATTLAIFDTFLGGCIKGIMESRPVQYFKHKGGILPSTYDSRTEVSSAYNILAYAYDNSNTKFISFYEGTTYPFYYTTFDPALKVYQEPISTANAEDLSLTESESETVYTYLGHFFASEARRNQFTFGAESSLSPYLIDKWTLKTVPGYSNKVYFPS